MVENPIPIQDELLSNVVKLKRSITLRRGGLSAARRRAFSNTAAVIQDRRGVHGLTTAATIWLVASIGMACGAGFHDLAAISTLIVIVVLAGLLKPAKPLARYAQKQQTKTESAPDDQDETSQERT